MNSKASYDYVMDVISACKGKGVSTLYLNEKSVIAALGRINEPERLSSLCVAAADNRSLSYIVRAAADLLAEKGTPAALTELYNKLKRLGSFTRNTIAERITDKDSLLQIFTNDDDAFVRKTILRKLAGTALSPQEIETVSAGLEDEYSVIATILLMKKNDDAWEKRCTERTVEALRRAIGKSSAEGLEMLREIYRGNPSLRDEIAKMDGKTMRDAFEYTNYETGSKESAPAIIFRLNAHD